MRACFSKLLTEAATKDPRIMMLSGDHGYALFDAFRNAHPDRFLNCGIAEQNMMGVAAGLAKAGYRPIVYGLAAFVPMRVLEQIKIDICYENLPIAIIGDGAGVVYSQLGASHQCNEDITALRALPNIDLYSPCDVAELEYVFQHMLEWNGPTYLRFGKADLGAVHAQKPVASKGCLIPVIETDSKETIIATGSMVYNAKALAKQLGNLSVWSAPVISPIDRNQLMNICTNHDRIFVMEEHSVNGGLGSLVAETACECLHRPMVKRIGIENKFSEDCGDYAHLMAQHGLDYNSLENRLRQNMGISA